MGQRRALSIGVTAFDRHERLDFAADRVRRLAKALADLRYEVREVAPETLSSGELGALVTGTLSGASTGAAGDDDLAVVHLVSHGERADGDATLFALGSDGLPHPDTSIAHWLTMQQATGQPPALFLLDLCSAGTSARLPWQVRLDQPIRGWVIAACGPAESAYDGRFTEAVITVLEALAAGELDIDPSMPHVPLSTVARAIRQEVNRRAEADDAYPQQVTASQVDISADVEPPFFPNPAYDPVPRPRLRAAVDPGVLPFLDDLDEGLDARHFLERATGLGRLTDTESGLVGCFTGRDRELRQVSPWLNGIGDETLCVVTGSPGAGKSALLGVLVCAANPLLRETTRPIWNGVAQAPLPVPDLAAVHARQRGLATVAASIARQLGLPENSSPADLVAALRGRSARPVLVLDALDEADDPDSLMTGLLLPLTDPDAPGTPVRVLVGVRRYENFAPLFDRAWLLDLDDVEQLVLEDNLFDYVKSLLRTTVEYRARGGVTGEFAQGVANVLAEPDVDGRRRWGPFLVAGLYTRHFITANAERVVTDPAVAGELGRRVPADLRGVLDLDLELERDQFWLRPVMIALAHARGAGMPVSVLTRIAPVFADPAAGPVPAPTAAQVRAVLSAARFYLRQSMDSDRSNLYRLFHQGLADTLAVRSPEVAGAVLDALLSSLGAADSRDWDAAEPYLFRHAAAHAADADRAREIETDPGLLLHPASSLALTAAAGDSHAAESVAAGARRYAGITTPAALALAAARAGDTELAARAANMADRPPLTWQPRWTVGSPVAADPARSRAGAPGAGAPGEDAAGEDTADEFESIAISADGTRVAAVGRGGLVSWSWSQGVPSDPVAAPDRTGHLVLVSADGGEIVVARLDTVLGLHAESLGVVASTAGKRVVAGVPSGESDFVLLHADGEIARCDFRRGTYGPLDRHTPGGSAWAVGHGPAGPVVVSSDDGRLVFFEDGRTSRDHFLLDRPVTAFAISPDGTRLAAGTGNGWVLLADRRNADTTWNHSVVLDDAVTSLAFTPDGDAVAVGCRDGSVSVVGLDGTLVHLARLAEKPITAIAVSERSERVVALDSRGAHCFDPAAGTVSHLRAPRVAGVARARGQDQVVTAFTAYADDVVVGFADGSLALVKVDNGEEHPVMNLDTPALDLVSVDLGGRPGLLVDTADGYRLTHDHVSERGGPGRLGHAGWAAARFRDRPPATHIGVDGRLVEVVLDGDALTTWDVGRGRPADPLGEHPGCRVVHCAYVDDRPLAFTGGDDGRVRVWDLTTRRLLDTLDLGHPVWRIALRAGRHLLVGAGGELLAFHHVTG